VAARAEALGVAALVPRAACTEERVAEAVGRVLAESAYRDAARRASERLRADDPVRRACGGVEDLLEGESRGESPAAR
jgi:UDP:flavonoid glycosyltransferase YjiC (YdhE family)